MAKQKLKKNQTVIYQEAEYKFLMMLGSDKVILSSDGVNDAFHAPLSEISLPGETVKTYTEEERNSLIQQLLDVGSNAKAFTEKYKELREIVASAFYNNDKIKGTEKLDLGNDYYLKCKKAYSLKLDKNKIEETLLQMDASVVEGLIKYEPKLSETAYSKLPDDQKAIIDQIITLTPSLPTFELVVPKEEEV